MNKIFLEKNKNRIYWILSISFILFIAFLQFQSFILYTPKFQKENSKITVAEIYNVEKIKTTIYADYVYQIDGKLFKSGTGGENRAEFENWKPTESRKYAIIYNLENPKLNFLLSNKRLPESTELGIELESEYFDYENLKSIMMHQTVQSAYVKEKYFEEYWKYKKN